MIALSQSWLVAVKLHNPPFDTDAYVDSFDVSRAEYICTHVCLIYVFAERLQSRSSAWTPTFSLFPQLRSCTLGRDS